MILWQIYSGNYAPSFITIALVLLQKKAFSYLFSLTKCTVHLTVRAVNTDINVGLCSPPGLYLLCIFSCHTAVLYTEHLPTWPILLSVGQANSSRQTEVSTGSLHIIDV